MRPTGGVCCACCSPNPLNSSANLGAKCAPPESPTQLHTFECIEHEIGPTHLGQTAIGRLATDKAAIFGQLVDRLATTADGEIFAALPAHRDTGLDVGEHPGEIGPVR